MLLRNTGQLKAAAQPGARVQVQGWCVGKPLDAVCCVGQQRHERPFGVGKFVHVCILLCRLDLLPFKHHRQIGAQLQGLALQVAFGLCKELSGFGRQLQSQQATGADQHALTGGAVVAVRAGSQAFNQIQNVDVSDGWGIDAAHGFELGPVAIV